MQPFFGFGGFATVQPRFAVAHAAGQMSRAGMVFLREDGTGQSGALLAVLLIFKRLKLPPALPFLFIGGIVPRINRNFSGFQRPDAAAQLIQKRAIMTDDQHGARETIQLPDQLPRSLRVQVGGRFVQKQQAWPGIQSLRHAPPRAFAARKAIAQFLGGQPPACVPALCFLAPAKLCRHAQRYLADHAPGIRLQLSGKDFHQGRFARAVFTDQPQAFAVVDFQPVNIQYFAFPKFFFDLFSIQKQHK